MGVSSSTRNPSPEAHEQREQETLASAALSIPVLRAAFSRSANANALLDALVPSAASFCLPRSLPSPTPQPFHGILTRFGPAIASQFFGHGAPAAPEGDARWVLFLRGLTAAARACRPPARSRRPSIPVRGSRSPTLGFSLLFFPTRWSRAASLRAARALGPDSGGGNDGSASLPGGVPCEGALQDTPDYIRSSVARHRAPPLELFSASDSPPPPAVGFVATAEGTASGENYRVAGGVSESEAVCGGHIDSESLQPEEIEEDKSDCCGLLKQQNDVILQEEDVGGC